MNRISLSLCSVHVVNRFPICCRTEIDKRKAGNIVGSTFIGTDHSRIYINSEIHLRILKSRYIAKHIHYTFKITYLNSIIKDTQTDLMVYITVILPFNANGIKYSINKLRKFRVRV